VRRPFTPSDTVLYGWYGTIPYTISYRTLREEEYFVRRTDKSRGKSAFRDFYGIASLRAGTYFFIGNVQNSELEVEIKIKSMYFTFY
jgi:hypothetical protein